MAIFLVFADYCDRPSQADGFNEDAEGEDDGEDGGDAEDQQLYCYCQNTSYGEVGSTLYPHTLLLLLLLLLWRAEVKRA